MPGRSSLELPPHTPASTSPRSGVFPLGVVVAAALAPESGDMLRAWPSSSSPFRRERLSSMTESTLRSFDSDLRDWCKDEEAVGCECRRLRPEVVAALLRAAGGEMDRVGEAGPELGAEPGGGELDGTSAHAAVSGKKPPVAADQEFLAEGVLSLLSRSGVDVSGLGVEEGALAMTESGGRMLKI